MGSMVLTQVYLEAMQKMALLHQRAVMNVLTDVTDRLTDRSALHTQVTELMQQQRDMGSIMLTQQHELAEVRGQQKAQMQAAASRQ